MKEEGLTFEDALADLISRRDCVAPNRGFCDQLKILQDQCDSKLERYEPEMLRVSLASTYLVQNRAMRATTRQEIRKNGVPKGGGLHDTDWRETNTIYTEYHLSASPGQQEQLQRNKGTAAELIERCKST